MTIVPRRASKKVCLRNPPLSQEDWSPFNNVVSSPVEFTHGGFDRAGLARLNKYCDSQLSFAAGGGFLGGSHALNYSSCLGVIEAMGVNAESRVLEFGFVFLSRCTNHLH